MHIEHLLPRAWKRHWPVSDLAAEIAREQHVHRLGNLTLLTQTLNNEVSNGPWLGTPGKHAALQDHDVCLMTRDVRQQQADRWDEDAIDARTDQMVAALLETWPVPDGHEGHIDQPVVGEASVSVSHLVAAGLLAAGTELYPRDAGRASAWVMDDGRLRVDGHVFDSPSGAGRVVLGRKVNGWYYWRLSDGRRLMDLRDDFLRSGRGRP